MDKTHASCEGYGIWGGGHKATLHRGSSHANNKACVALSVYQPSSFPSTLNQHQINAFSHFQQYLAKKIPGVFESGFWSKLVLQASVQEPAVLHSVIALAACQAGNERLALNNYNRAIIELRQHLTCNTKYALRFTLITCMLFTCLELVRGERKASEIHLQNGLRLLSDLQSRTPRLRVASSKNVITLTQHTETSDDCIVEAFTRLNVQSALFGQGSTFLYELGDDPRKGVSKYSTASNFSTVTEARQHLDFFMNGVLWLSSQGDSLTQEGKKITNDLHRKRRILESSLDHWMVALQSSPFARSPNVGGDIQTRFGIRILRIYHTMIKIMVATCLRGKDEMIYDRYIPDFTSLLQQVWELWTQAAVEFGTIHHVNSFTADLGYIPPLYYTSLRCRDPNLRRIAIDLLAKAPHSEGAWDGRLASVIAKKVMDIEESNIYQGYEMKAGVIEPLNIRGSLLPTVPAPARINSIAIIPDPTERYKNVK
ncbi:C6 zinc finger domain protein [Fusarium beomiforme]|uniref:C6 zinc finger domain protein n=1 Tax=Fusarium beomiforme TaxID=44412 RepID=A0A9P5AHQ4_9HYPO|nr:C6 zinc finger domain protein [Fusarium beomiforme]